MRHLVIAATLAGLVATGAEANAHTSLETKRSYLLGSVAGQQVCSNLCVMSFTVRPGEKYLHLIVGSSLTGGAAAVDLKSVSGPVHVCANTKSGPIDIDGLKAVTITPVLYDPTCNPAGVNVTGTVAAFFSDHAMSLFDAMENATPDPDRAVSGGF